MDATRLLAVEAWIDSAYETLRKNPQFHFRPTQKDLSHKIAKALLTSTPLMQEAPTGTGKTLGYMIAALAVNKAGGSKGNAPVVVATATKALQQQLMTTDLPRMVQAGLITARDVGLAKGKGNYICLARAAEVEGALRQSEMNPDIYVQDEALDINPDDVAGMLQAFEDSFWDGDFDHYDWNKPRSVIPIAVSSDTCTQKRCPRYGDCAYYQARNQLAGRSVIVTNHDLLLRDLKLVSEDLEPTLPVDNYSLIVDEAHHFPDKAIKVGETEASPSRLLNALPRLTGAARLIERNPSIRDIVASGGVKLADLDTEYLRNITQEVLHYLEDTPIEEDSSQAVFRGGTIPEDLAALCLKWKLAASTLSQTLGKVVKLVRDKSTGFGPALKDRANEVLYRCLDVMRLTEGVIKTVDAFEGETPVAKWMAVSESGAYSLHSCPLEGHIVLTPLMWKSERVTGVAMVSATLRSLGTFNRFKFQTGAPRSTETAVLPPFFPYDKSTVHVRPMSYTPKFNERDKFIRELQVKLPKDIDPKEGTLILFSSWSMLKQVVPSIKSVHGALVKVQGERALKALLTEHEAAISAKRGSILVGVATLAEGLDLPGDLCTHVMITALPFAAPTDPVEQELSDILKNKYFGERSLPDASMRLAQMTGRLLRRETDVGRISIYDRRIVSTSYGRQMLMALPGYTRVIHPIA